MYIIMRVRVDMIQVVRMDFQLVRRKLVVIVVVMQRLEHVTNVVQRLINILVVEQGIVGEAVLHVVVNIRVVPVQVVITGVVVLVYHIVIHVQVDRMNQVQVVVMEHLEQYLRNVAAAQHPEHVILVRHVPVVHLVLEV